MLKPNRSFISSFFHGVSSAGGLRVPGVTIPSASVPFCRLRNCSYSSTRCYSNQSQMEPENYKFGPYKIDNKEVFLCTHLSYAMVISFSLRFAREVKRFTDLTADETADLWLTAQKVGRQLESFHSASSITFAIQDGPQAGQTVPHVHIHIIPRRSGDFEKNDEIYDALDVKEKELNQKLDLDKDRKDRSMEEMAEEAEHYRKLFA
ncbi:OLC1v1006507C1 [Oldenlandia corymbosa var. corymbosa]|uniref:OLC1v1006507C1 n=1 Tax=Oldenlandia corymbosa var. corymbosa TaxID=529605 RepID=A0AAV1DJV1_OLDCO|nr:OLC1v1006507C1 [Oldenlandia corymbosa var. corymbosa]